MPRKYDASRRAEAAQKTREAILAAAFELHGRGIIDLESLAERANVSLATVRKYFPTREELYLGCTNWGLQRASSPDVDLIASFAEPEERLRTAVAQVHAFYDSLFGQFWMTYVHEADSAVLAAIQEELDGVLRSVVDLIVAPWPAAVSADAESRGVIRGLISYLTYYALIREGGLSPEQAHERIVEALLNSLQAMTRSRRKEGANV